MAYKIDPNWVWPDYFEPHPRMEKSKSRAGETRKLNNLLKKAKKQGIVVKADIKGFEEFITGKYYIYDVNSNTKLSPDFRTSKECLDILDMYLR